MDDFPDDIQGLLRLAYQYASPYMWPMLSHTNTARAFIYQTLYPLLQPIFLWCLDASAQTPALGVVFLLASIFIAYKIMSLTQRVMGYLAFMVLRMSFWAVLVMGVGMVWQRGVERSASDAVAIGKVVMGKWGEEYQKYNDGGGVAAHKAGGKVGGGNGWWS